MWSRGVKSIEKGATLAEAARRTVEEKVGSLVVMPVADEGTFGIITRKDNVNAIADGCDARAASAGNASTQPVVITPGVLVSYTARMMKRTGMRHLAGFNGREIVGIISNIDILRAMSGK